MTTPVNHLFPTRQPVFALGQKLIAPVQTALTFNPFDFIPNLTNTSEVSNVNWDFGDGSTNLADGSTAASVAHTFAEVGRYIVSCQVMYGASATTNETAQSTQMTQREVEIIITPAQLFTTAILPFIASIHGTFRDDKTGKVAHALVILPQMSAVVTGSVAGQDHLHLVNGEVPICPSDIEFFDFFAATLYPQQQVEIFTSHPIIREAITDWAPLPDDVP